MLCYMSIINVLGFLLMYIDKRRAVRGRSRIPELTLLGTSAIGGSIGTLIGMYLFHHKTNNFLFMILVPTMPALQFLFFILSRGLN